MDEPQVRDIVATTFGSVGPYRIRKHEAGLGETGGRSNLGKALVNTTRTHGLTAKYDYRPSNYLSANVPSTPPAH